MYAQPLIQNHHTLVGLWKVDATVPGIKSVRSFRHLLTFQLFFLMFHKADLCSLQSMDPQMHLHRTNCHNKTTQTIHIQVHRPSQYDGCAVYSLSSFLSYIFCFMFLLSQTVFSPSGFGYKVIILRLLALIVNPKQKNMQDQKTRQLTFSSHQFTTQATACLTITMTCTSLQIKPESQLCPLPP